MKKDLKKLLSAQAQNILPDERVKENIKSELGCSDGECAYAHGNTESKGKKNILVISVAVLMALTLCLCILLPVFLKGTGTPGGGGKFNQIETTEDFYAYGAASVGSLLSASSETRTLRSYRPSDEEMETVGRYMALVEGLLGDGNFEYSESASSDGVYAYSMTVRYRDLLGREISYEMRYDRLLSDQKGEYAIAGVLLVGQNEYPVEGSYQIESEDGETESELWFRAYTDDAGKSYIEVMQESEEETEDGETEREQKYVYDVYENGRRVERTVVEYESEEGELELKMVVQNRAGRDELRFEQEKKGELKVRGQMNGKKTEFTVQIRLREDGTTYYRYIFEDASDDEEEDED